MRLDKYLKISRLIKRRTVAKDAATAGVVTVNGKVAKPSVQVEIGDIVTLEMGEKIVKVKVTNIKEHVRKEEASEMYQVIEE